MSEKVLAEYFAIEVAEEGTAACVPVYTLVGRDNDVELSASVLAINDDSKIAVINSDAANGGFDGNTILGRVKVLTKWNRPVYKDFQVTKEGAGECHIETLSLASRNPI